MYEVGAIALAVSGVRDPQRLVFKTSHHAACALPTETGKRRHAENNPSSHRSGVTVKPVERGIGMAVELLGDAEKIRRPIVIQCHTDGPLVADKSRILRPFSMILAVPTETRVRFPSPAPLFSSANSQFFQALSYECHTKPPGSVPFHWAFTAGIETVVQGQVIPLIGWRFP